MIKGTSTNKDRNNKKDNGKDRPRARERENIHDRGYFTKIAGLC
ncbi:MAG: hypothetical protein OP8BY_1072 [Candidatus Saccharicenans subterraneus]|uniref:Uncharacterized protein n=1 Tax=Candidatus Saccharicenans subterraneus TaxID=2508984 RepID=A0A3E2BQT3_9BACT|nr:MAG: hypothetical protein OP8BY_1072 [Candidatus Saccharicenans subterraneum]